MKKTVLLVALAALALGGCASRAVFTGGPGLEVTQHQALPLPAHVDPNGTERPYRLGPLDRIRVAVYGNDALSAEAQVDASGRVSLPLVGSVEAAGRTPTELEEMVRAGLRANYVRDPRVSINLVEAVSQLITVDGAVREPGQYPVIGRTSLMRTIAQAKGVTEFATLNDVVVFRNIGDQRMAALYSLRAIREGRYADPELFAGDVVVVGDSPGRRLFRDIASMGGLLTAPLVAIVR
ncbi:MAG: polysaccharide biosynthesis/export family protein [Allosphingosinicella sp.]|uniref:polysaccharide biosynthesis/export family protein n=1 Tax=Allosphingosinicella sp. TaxID=2823234 RepID=UPI00395AE183